MQVIHVMQDYENNSKFFFLFFVETLKNGVVLYFNLQSNNQCGSSRHTAAELEGIHIFPGHNVTISSAVDYRYSYTK